MILILGTPKVAPNFGETPQVIALLGTPVIPFCPFYFGVSSLKMKSRKRGTLIIHGLLGNLDLLLAAEASGSGLGHEDVSVWTLPKPWYHETDEPAE